MNIKVTGGKKLSGHITPSGNKNAVLPMLAASLLTTEIVVLENVPDITDVGKMLELFGRLGVKSSWDKEAKRVEIDSSNLNLDDFEGNMPMTMRATVLMFAPLLSRCGKIDLDFNIGGCTLGIRDIDPHIDALETLGVKIEKLPNGGMELDASRGFQGGHIWTEYASVTGTENSLMAAVISGAETVIDNAASEPHVQNLCEMLIGMGAKIEGVGSNKLIIHGVSALGGGTFRVWADHHEIVTFLGIGAITGGEVTVSDALPEYAPLFTSAFAKLGVQIEYSGDTVSVAADQSFIPSEAFTQNMIQKIEAAPWPYFPVDLLPIMLAVGLKTKSTTKFWNKVYEAGLYWSVELVKMGATIEVEDPHRVLVLGPTKLRGAKLECPYIIRATIALTMAALAAEGESTLMNVDTLFRAHPNFIENLRALGAEIEEIG